MVVVTVVVVDAVVVVEVDDVVVETLVVLTVVTLTVLRVLIPVNNQHSNEGVSPSEMQTDLSIVDPVELSVK